MKAILKMCFSLLTILLLASCEPKPQPIEYGLDACHACRMNIVDQQHAAQLVTEKGKAFKFDAIECLVPYFNEQHDSTPFALVLVADYAQPGALVDGRQAHYLISEAVPSPMGGNLSAFSDRTAAQEMQTDKGGELLGWEQLRRKYER